MADNTDDLIETILCSAVQIDSPQQRQDYLDKACGGNEPLRQQLDRLVRAHFRAGEFLEQPARVITVAQPNPLDVQIGVCIGPYKIREKMGEGGMGIVFVAEQERPVRRLVALKVIKPGMDSHEVIARFEAERQALAMMDHPNIAKVLDVGATESGHPYFAMELVRGIPITDYCDERKLSPRERLSLLIQVCQAVHHAHQKGIIHRDIKPSNVLVAPHDGSPVPKVIDFGIAKALHQRLTDRTIYTRLSQIVGTPLYMSPEQAELNALDVDTRSDVYSLGVLLYELLTGLTPFDREVLQKADYDEMRRIIREDEPLRPSQRISTLGMDARSTISARRSVDDRTLLRVLRGELDWITLKALEKDRTRRYESASALAADVRRYLEDLPVEACPPSRVYRLRKFARKHRIVLATSLAIVLALVSGASIAAWQALRAHEHALETKRALVHAQRQQRLAESRYRQTLTAVRDTYRVIASKWLAHDVELQDDQREFLARALLVYRDLVDQKPADPQAQFEMAVTMVESGHIEWKLGLYDAAKSNFHNALNSFSQLAQRQYDRVEVTYWIAQTKLRLADLAEEAADELGDTSDSEAEKLLNDARRAAVHHHDLARAGTAEQRSRALLLLAACDDLLSILQMSTDRLDQAQSTLARLIGVYEQLKQEHPRNAEYSALLGAASHNLARLYIRKDDLKRAEELAESAVLHQRSALELGPSAVSERYLANHHQLLFEIHRQYGDLQTSEEQLRLSIDIREKLAAQYPQQYDVESWAKTLNELGVLLKDEGRLDEATAVFEQALKIFQDLVVHRPNKATYQNWVGGTLHNLSETKFESGQEGQALELIEQALAVQQTAFDAAPDHPRVRRFLAQHFQKLAFYRANALDASLRSPQEALTHAHRSLELMDDPVSSLTLAVCQIRSGKLNDAIGKLQKLSQVQLGDHFECERLYWLSLAHGQLGQHDEARANVARANAAWARLQDTKARMPATLQRLRDETLPMISVE